MGEPTDLARIEYLYPRDVGVSDQHVSRRVFVPTFPDDLSETPDVHVRPRIIRIVHQDVIQSQGIKSP